MMESSSTNVVKKVLSWCVPFVVIGFGLTRCSTTERDVSQEFSILPQKGDTGDWQPVDSPRAFAGEDLFELINGGAEIYHEYGFRRVLAWEYQRGEEFLNLEIYEMSSPAAAYGMYTFKTGDKGEEVPIGDEGLLEGYYLNFWKGNFVITLVGFDSTEETLSGLKTVAEAVDERIETGGRKPALVDLLPKENLKKTAVTYLKGNLALFNRYEFDSKNIFGLEEGIVGEYPDYELFIFKYDDGDQALKWYSNGRESLNANPRFRDLVDHDDGFSVVDDDAKSLFVQPCQRSICVVRGKSESEARVTIQEVKAAMAANE